MRNYKYAIRELYLNGRSAEEIEAAIILGCGGNASITKEDKEYIHNKVKTTLAEFERGNTNEH